MAEKFPAADLLAQVSTEQELEAKAVVFKAKFNGDRLMQLLPGLSGKALGEFIVKLKDHIPGFEDYVLMNEQEEIDRKIVDFYHHCGTVPLRSDRF